MALDKFKNGEVLTETQMNKIVAEVNGKASTAVATTSVNGLMDKGMVAKLNGIDTNANNYTHPTNSGNKHIPSGGSAGKVLKWSEDGAVTWGDDLDHTYGVVSKTLAGLVPQLPDETTTTKYFRQDGTWVVPPNNTYKAATESVLGLVKKASTQADSVATDIAGLVADFNGLLAKLKEAGLIS